MLAPHVGTPLPLGEPGHALPQVEQLSGSFDVLTHDASQTSSGGGAQFGEQPPLTQKSPLEHAFVHPPQWFLSLFKFDSQPLAASLSQFAWSIAH